MRSAGSFTLKKDAIANDDVKTEVTAVAGQNAAGEDLLNFKDGKVTLAKQAAKGETDKEAMVEQSTGTE